jgi:hypothetical protein
MKGYKRFIVTSFFVVFLLCSAASAAPTTSDQAANVVKGWLNYNSSPFGELAGEFSKVEAYGESGKASGPSETLYYAVYIDPSGIVLIPAEDELDPITAYARGATWYGPSPANPLYDSIGASIAEMVKKHRGSARRASGTSEARGKWASLEKLAQGGRRGSDAQIAAQDQLPGLTETPIVDKLLETEWDQENAPGYPYVFNAFTPSNYPAGCGAVMMAQIMNYFKWPAAPIRNLVGDRVYPYSVNSKPQPGVQLMGGDGNMGPYNWDNSDEDIGRLMADCAVAIGSDFGEETESYPDRIADELVSSFGYGNAVLAKAKGSSLVSQMNSETLLRAVNSNLDAGKPVGLGIYKRISENNFDGHGVVVDGYGYSVGTIYHHINMGWGDSSNLNIWYNLPLVYNYDLVDSVIYNIYSRTPSTGTEIISGRVVTSTDEAPKGAIITMTGENFSGTVIIPDTATDGRFVFAGVPSNTKFTILAALGGHSFPVAEVTTGESYSPTQDNGYTSSVGNVWGVVIQESPTEGGGCGVASYPALFAIVGTGAVFVIRRKRKR